MSELDPLTEQQVALFLRIDAAMPSDPVLRAVADLWLEKRSSRIMPSLEDMKRLPDFMQPHVFEADLTINGDRHWIVSGAGNLARLALGLEGLDSGKIAKGHMAERLHHLFDLVSQKAEPYSVMFEVKQDDGKRQLVEVYAAPLATPERSEHRIFAALCSRTEAMP